MVSGGGNPPPTRVIYAASSEAHERSYRHLETELPWVEFVRASDFKADLLRSIDGFSYFLFLVDDNLFVRAVSLTRCREWLERRGEAVGFSLRLGRNTRYCYTLNRPQALPQLDVLEPNFLAFRWTGQEADFGYPLELSSSIYRVEEIRAMLEQLPYRHPNSLEGMMAQCAQAYAPIRPVLLCPEFSITFCASLNRVQSVALNRAGETHGRSADELRCLFDARQRPDFERDQGYTPGGCHEEVPLMLRPHAGTPRMSQGGS